MIKKIVKYFIDKLGYEVINKKEFGNNILRDFRTLYSENKAVTIFDIGANLGQTSLEFIECVPNSIIYAFEPDPNTFLNLINQISNYKNIKSYNLGFGERIDKMELSINKVSGGNSLLSLSENINKYAKGDWTEKI
jgi:MinD-like ATPase involved in chromosome partitioning or flagellar assembly